MRRLETGADSAPRVLPLGAAALDCHLPGGGLPLGVLHEIEGRRAEWDDGVAAAFCLALLSRILASRPAPALWAGRSMDLYGPGLLAFGLDPARLVLVRCSNAPQSLWVMEEALRCRALTVVVGEVDALPPSAGRRLQLAAESSGVTALLLRRRFGPPRRAEPPSAAVTRWQVAPAASCDRRLTKLPGHPRWHVNLLRCRGAAPGRFTLGWARGEWDDAPHRVALAAPLRNRKLATAQRQDGQARQRPIAV